MISVRAAYVLASEIEWVNAQARAAERPLRRGENRQRRAENEYDPLAATCLAELILSRLNHPSARQP